ncbi:MAG TPA: hypothetical protein VLS88_14135 [Polyangiales bacterium]|nr:hypothetical protein [Polyangiales bacterium]
MRRMRVIGMWILVAVLLAFVLSNWEMVHINMLGMQILEAPASVVILISAGLGMGLGVLIRAIRSARRT